MKAVDSHCHLDFEQFDKDRDKVIQESKQELKFIVNAGSNLEHNKAAIKLGEKYEDFIIPTLGLHPVYQDSYSELEEIKKQIRQFQPAAVGEIGLDHHHVEEDEARENQEQVFREMLMLAEKQDLPIVVHSRDAESKAVNIIEEYNISDVMLHCFNGSPSLAAEAVDKGMKIGVTTQVLYSDRVRRIVEEIRVSDLLLETDSPYLYRNERNKPSNVLESAEKIAEIKNVSKKEVIQLTNKNAERIFGK